MIHRRGWLLGGLAGVLCPALAQPFSDDDSALDPPGPQSEETLIQSGRATWYGGKRWHGRRTASGERFDRYALTAAHPTLPLGTWVKVFNTRSGQSVTVRINDRGPGGQRFIIDLSEAAAQRLGMLGKGHASVEIHRTQAPRPAR